MARRRFGRVVAHGVDVVLILVLLLLFKFEQLAGNGGCGEALGAALCCHALRHLPIHLRYLGLVKKSIEKFWC